MNEEIYHQMAKVEERHWWFAGRRQIVASFLDRLAPSHDAAILEAGCGTGGNFHLLARYGRVHAMEFDETALRYAEARGNAEICRGMLPDKIPFQGRAFDLILLLDVLEHVEDDVAALSSLAHRLADGGALLITVPAYRFLWGSHDVAHRHFRRYSARELREKIERAGLHTQRMSYHNTFLFPIICLARIFCKKSKPQSPPPGLSVPPLPLNVLLKLVFAAERHLLPLFSLPFGVSLICVVRKAPTK